MAKATKKEKVIKFVITTAAQAITGKTTVGTQTTHRINTTSEILGNSVSLIELDDSEGKARKASSIQANAQILEGQEYPLNLRLASSLKAIPEGTKLALLDVDGAVDFQKLVKICNEPDTFGLRLLGIGNIADDIKHMCRLRAEGIQAMGLLVSGNTNNPNLLSNWSETLAVARPDDVLRRNDSQHVVSIRYNEIVNELSKYGVPAGSLQASDYNAQADFVEDIDDLIEAITPIYLGLANG